MALSRQVLAGLAPTGLFTVRILALLPCKEKPNLKTPQNPSKTSKGGLQGGDEEAPCTLVGVRARPGSLCGCWQPRATLPRGLFPGTPPCLPPARQGRGTCMAGGGDRPYVRASAGGGRARGAGPGEGCRPPAPFRSRLNGRRPRRGLARPRPAGIWGGAGGGNPPRARGVSFVFVHTAPREGAGRGEGGAAPSLHCAPLASGRGRGGARRAGAWPSEGPALPSQPSFNCAPSRRRQQQPLQLRLLLAPARPPSCTAAALASADGVSLAPRRCPPPTSPRAPPAPRRLPPTPDPPHKLLGGSGGGGSPRPPSSSPRRLPGAAGAAPFAGTPRPLFARLLPPSAPLAPAPNPPQLPPQPLSCLLSPTSPGSGLGSGRKEEPLASPG